MNSKEITKITKYLGPVYGEYTDILVSDITSKLEMARSTYKMKIDLDQGNMYVVYPDVFEGKKDKYNFSSIIELIPKLRELNVTLLHILPPFESPMIDQGFDIADYLKFREELGDLDDFRKLLEICREHKINVMLDLVLNHVSDKHKWFQYALDGDKKYKEYFIKRSRDNLPTLKNIEKIEGAIYAKYEENNHDYTLPVIFPEFSGTLPHWTTRNEQDYYYHTFYPHQIDLNWDNPDVFLEIVDILIYWVDLGLHFRLDAVNFLHKRIHESDVSNREETHLIIKALNLIVKQISPNSKFLVEAPMKVEDLLKYLGDDDNIEAEYAYNFPLTSLLWQAYALEDSSFIKEGLKFIRNAPKHTNFVNLLRTHDELFIRYFEPETARKKALEFFRTRAHIFEDRDDICGRTASLTDNNLNQFLMMYSIIFALPGIPMIMYGDEIGKVNDAKNLKLEKDKAQKNKVDVDERALVRGRYSVDDYQSEKGQKYSTGLKTIADARKSSKVMINGSLSIIDTNIKELFVFYREYKGEKILVIVNVSSKPVSYESDRKLKTFLISHKVDMSLEKLNIPPYFYGWFEVR